MRRILWTVLLLCLCRVSFALGTLKVTSEPSGVVVSLDGKRVARTPCKLGVPPGEHKVSAEAKRYDSDSRTVSIKDGKETSIHLTLLPTPIEIKVKCEVKEAQVRIDGEEVGPVNKVVKARPGSRELVVVKDGYKDYVRKVQIPWRTTGKKPKEYAVKLKKGVSFRSGSVLSSDGWTLKEWRFENGRLIYNKGGTGRASYAFERGKVLAMQCRFRASNVSWPLIVTAGMGSVWAHSMPCDGKWHTLLTRINGREGTMFIDGKAFKEGGASEEEPAKIFLFAGPPDNNDPFRFEISQMVLKQFNSVAEMKAAVQP